MNKEAIFSIKTLGTRKCYPWFVSMTKINKMKEIIIIKKLRYIKSKKIFTMG